ncbi:MAG: endo alpha-1,4 polygalactosaminidase [Actinomycetes bacterium]
MRRISRWLTAAACLSLLSLTAGGAEGASTETSAWAPAPGATWQWQIVGSVDTSLDVQMYDIDLFDARPKQVNGGVIDQLHADGHTVVCYVDTGAWESYRPDASQFPRSVIGNATYASNGKRWKGERWLDIRPKSWDKFAPIIWARLDLAVDLGCDGVEPDQNNPWGNKPGFPITLKQQKRWYLEVAAQAHARGLSVGMKNGVEVVDADTVAAFDWALNEECFQYHECGAYDPFIAGGKAVFNVEYIGRMSSYCPKAVERQFSTLKKRLALGAWRKVCQPG